MKAIKVQYTVKPEYTEENKKNIQRVMDVLKAKPIEGMQYSSFTDEESPNTFIHINMAKDDEIMGKLNGLQEFKDFQQALKASQPLSPPKATKLKMVGFGFDMQ
ncbi:MAG: hypothetical protein WBG90_01305 [Saonia sp.]